MNALSTLIRLELTRSRQLLIGSKQNKPSIILLAMIALMGIVLYMTGKPINASLYFFTSTVFFFEALFTSSFFQSLATIYGDYREWWLSFPQTRKTLVLAIFYARCIVGLVGVLYMLVIAVGAYGIASLEHWTDPLVTSSLIRIIIANGMLACASIPFAVGISLLTFTLQIGWGKVINALFLFIVFDGVVGGWGFSIAAFQDNHDYTILMPSHIVQYSIGMIILGWTIAYICIHCTAKYMNRLGEVRYKTSTSRMQQKVGVPSDNRVRKSLRRNDLHPFWVLVVFEYTRFRCLGKRAPWYVRFIIYGFMLVLTVGGYFSAGSLEGLAWMPHFLFMMGYVGIVMFTMNSVNWEFQKGRGQWWLTYPYSRFILLASRLIGQVSAFMVYLFLALFSTGVGFCIHFALHPESYRFLSFAERYWESSAILYIVLTVCNVCILQLTPVLYKTRVLKILYIPLFFSYFFGIRFMSYWVIPNDDYQAGPLPSYSEHIGILLTIGIPLAIVCFSLGAKYLNEYSNIQFQNRLLNKKSQ